MAIFTDVTTNFDIQDHNIWNELEISINERLLLYHDAAPLTLTVANDDIQDRNRIRRMQSSVLNIIGNLDTEIFKGNISDTLDSIDTYSSYEDIFSSASLRPDGFRRATEYDPEVNDWTDINDSMWIPNVGGAFNDSRCSIGDIIGPWIFDDLQKVLRKLNVFVFDAETADVENYSVDNYANTDVSGGHDWAAMISLASSVWPSNIGKTVVYPQASAVGNLFYDTTYRVRYERRKVIYAVDTEGLSLGLSNLSPEEAEEIRTLGGISYIFVKAIKKPYSSEVQDSVFDANGENFEENKYVKQHEFTLSGSDRYIISELYGNFNKPEAPPEPTVIPPSPDSEQTTTFRGYYADDLKQLVRLNWTYE